MSFTFSVMAKVPDDTIRVIGNSLVEDLLDRLNRRSKLSSTQLDIVQYHANKAIINLVVASTTVVDGYSLTNEEIIEIASLIRIGERIATIKAFFSATGAGLKMSKEFIDKFPLGVEGANKFLRTFQ